MRRPTPWRGRPSSCPSSPRPASWTRAGPGSCSCSMRSSSSLDGRPLPRALGRGRPPTSPRPTAGAPRATPTGAAVTTIARDLRYEVMYLLDAPDDTIPAVQGGLGGHRRLHRGGRWRRPLELPHPHRRHRRRHRGGPGRRPPPHPGHRPRRAGRGGALGARERRDAGPGPTAVRARRPTTGVVAVVSGDGIGRIFRSLGVTTWCRAARR